MATVDRTVRRLHLQAASHEDARRAALRLEDALRCASLPDTGRRLLFVRRLDLGAVRADASAQAWALTLERAMSQSDLRWLPGDAPQAATADAVWFRDALHAHLALGLRLARGPAPVEWFWPRLLPALAQAPDAPAALAAVMQAVAALPEAPAALPAWIAALSHEGFTQAVITAVPRADVGLLWRVLGGVPGPASEQVRAAAGGPAFIRDGAPASAGPQAPLQAVQRAHAARALVAHALRLAGEERAARRVEAAGFGGALDASGGRVLSVEPTNDARMAPPRAAGEPAQLAESAPAAQAADAPLPAVRPSPAVPVEALLLGDAWPWADGRPTAAGGALLLVPLLERLGYAGWLASLPAPTAQRCIAALWADLFTRLGLPPQDPAWALAGGAAGTEALPAPDARALADVEARRCPAAKRRGAGPWYGTTACGERHPSSHLWLALARRWLRRRAGLGLRALVLRPAWLALTATHADLVFDLDATDLRVRRAGLDLDPGWVPWLGRVVGFHFERLPWPTRP